MLAHDQESLQELVCTNDIGGFAPKSFLVVFDTFFRKIGSSWTFSDKPSNIFLNPALRGGIQNMGGGVSVHFSQGKNAFVLSLC